MPSRTARRSSTHFSSVAPDDDYDDDSTRGASVEVTEAEDPKVTLASNILATMMREIIIDTALHAHRSARRQRRADGSSAGGCPVCKTSCQASLAISHGSGDLESHRTFQSNESAADGSEPSATQPKGLEIYHNNPLLSCLVCSRQVSANRYAQHLASCVGVGKGGLARRKGKAGGASKIKTALENRRRAGYLMSGTSTPVQRSFDDTMSVTSDDDSGRKKSNLSSSFTLNGNGKRSASPMDPNEVSKKHKPGTPPRSSESGGRSQSLLGVTPHAASQPLAASPLNPHRNGQRPIKLVGDDDDDDDDADDYDFEAGSEEGEVKDSKRRERPRSTSVMSGAGSSDVYVQESTSERNYESYEDERLMQDRSKPGNTSDFAQESDEYGDDDDDDDDDDED